MLLVEGRISSFENGSKEQMEGQIGAPSCVEVVEVQKLIDFGLFSQIFPWVPLFIDFELLSQVFQNSMTFGQCQIILSIVKSRDKSHRVQLLELWCPILARILLTAPLKSEVSTTS